MSEKYLKPKEIEQKLQLSHATVYKLLHTDGFPMIKIGRNIRVKESDLERYLEMHKSHTIYF